MNIALTGSSGLIGSKLVDDLKKAGHEVLCISSSHSAHHKNIFLLNEIISENNFAKVDCFLHLASINSNLNNSQISEEVSLTHNAIKLMKVLKCKKLIFLSTSKVYGENSFKYEEYSELSPIKPQSPYAIAKVNCEQAIIRMSAEEDFNYFILRIPPMLLNNVKSNLGHLIKVVKSGFPIPSFKYGDQNERSFLSYELFLSAIEKIIGGQSKINKGIFNLADPKPISTNDLLRKISKDNGRKAKIIYLPNFIFQLMIKLNRLQLFMHRMYGNFNISSKSFTDVFFK